MAEADSFDPGVLERLKQLQDKYAAMGQDLTSYLDGLLHADFHVLGLHQLIPLSLQQPVTPFPDEQIFVIYHQITELYFKPRCWKSNRSTRRPTSTRRPSRAGQPGQPLLREPRPQLRHHGHGLDHEQFLKFRMSLLPSSGSERAVPPHRDCLRSLDGSSTANSGMSMPTTRLTRSTVCSMSTARASELASGEPTLTLKQFEKSRSTSCNSARALLHQPPPQGFLDPEHQTDELKGALRTLDELVNVHWPLSHYRSAVRHLQKDPIDIAATGGTNWQQYLPPRFQTLLFFPELWTEQEQAEWGKSWVMAHFAHK